MFFHVSFFFFFLIEVNWYKTKQKRRKSLHYNINLRQSSKGSLLLKLKKEKLRERRFP